MGDGIVTSTGVSYGKPTVSTFQHRFDTVVAYSNGDCCFSHTQTKHGRYNKSHLGANSIGDTAYWAYHVLARCYGKAQQTIKQNQVQGCLLPSQYDKTIKGVTSVPSVPSVTSHRNWDFDHTYNNKRRRLCSIP